MSNPFLIATVPHEGGVFSAEKDESAPIRIYSNGAVFDDICGGFREVFEPSWKREILTYISERKPVYRVKAHSIRYWSAYVGGELFKRLPGTGDADRWCHIRSGEQLMITACQEIGTDLSKITADAMLKVARRAKK